MKEGAVTHKGSQITEKSIAINAHLGHNLDLLVRHVGLAAILLVALIFGSTTDAFAESWHDGLPPGVAVPQWAVGQQIHFDPEPGLGLAENNSTPSVTKLNYFGGPAQTEPQVIPIFWGKNWESEPGSALKTELITMFNGLGKSSYQGILTQYSGPNGPIPSAPEIGEVYLDSRVAAPSNLNGPAIKAEAEEFGKIKYSDTTYFVFPAPGSTYEAGFDKGFCGYHESLTGNGEAFAFVPYAGNAPFEGCSDYAEEGKEAKDNADYATSWNASHEYAESVTDPNGETGWITEPGETGLEIADLCKDKGARQLSDGAWVSELWDDSKENCELEDASPGLLRVGPFLAPTGEYVTEDKQTSVELNADIELFDLELHYYFEYGATESYGTKTSEVSFPGIWGVQDAARLISGLTPHTIYHYRVVASTSNGTIYGPDSIMETALNPIVQTEPTTGARSTEATLNGSVDPEGAESKYYFEYGATTKYGERTAEASAGAGTSSVKESMPLTGLPPGTRYHVRIAASNIGGKTYGGDQVFTTPAGQPFVETRPASGVKATEATLKGVVNSEGHATKYYFEYGTSMAYGSKTTESGVAEENRNLEESGTITGLTANVAYHYRLVASNSVGTTYGADLTTSPWAVQASPNPEPAKSSYLEGVSCPSTTVCTAVGRETNSAGKELSLAERWSGGEWKIQSTPNPEGAKSTALEAVSCSASGACTAAGYYVTSAGTNVPLAERWNGTEWVTQSVPIPAGEKSGYLLAVSCPSSTLCIAAGEALNSSAVTTAFAEEWNGTEWKTQTTPNPAEATFSGFRGVSCSSTTACTVVGSYKNSEKTRLALVERWNGTEWKIQSVPNPEGAEASYLHAISCISATACTAVGSDTPIAHSEVPLAESWNGAEWKVQAAPDPEGGPAGGSSLLGVSCASATACTAVTFYQVAGAWVTLAEHWNGTEWKIQATPNSPTAKGSLLRAVSCPSSTICVASGDFETSSGTIQTLAEDWDGTEWTIQPTPNPEAAKESYLAGVSCSASTACGAAGYYENGSGVWVTFAERWNGSEWALESTPNPEGAKESYLEGIACTLSTACLATGHYESSSGTSTMLAEIWNGTEWKIQSIPNPEGAKESLLEGVSCSSGTGCTAIGYYENSASKWVTLVERWNGTEWKIQSTPNPEGAKESYLNGVSCSSGTGCAATGYYKNSAGKLVTLAETWNGTEWKVASPPNPEGAKESKLAGVSCPSDTACNATGFYKNSAGTNVTLAEHWNGHEWTIQSTPNPEGAKESKLSAVSCDSVSNCTAVGHYKNSSNTVVTLAESWNGTEWSIQATPNPEGGKENSLTGLSCAVSPTCIATGSYKNSSSKIATLAEILG